MRHALGFYGALTMTGLYSVHDTAHAFDPANLDHFVPALKHCIATHPILSAAIQGHTTESPNFIRPAYLDLRHHLHLHASLLKDDLSLITEVTKKTHDQPFLQVDQRPPWKVFIVPVADKLGSEGAQKAYVIFAYSHSHGDGKSGLAFHRSFLEGLQAGCDLYDQDYICRPSASPIPPPLEEACDLTISWSYLLLNLFGPLIPSFAANYFGHKQPAISNTWTGKAMCHEPSDFHTGSQALLVEKSLLDAAMRVCREHGVKFTGFFNQLVAHILDDALPRDARTENLLGQIVIDLRAQTAAYSEDQMANSVSALYVSSPRSHSMSSKGATALKHDSAFWNTARRTTIQLASSASTLADQPIGLLRYLSHFRPWFVNQLGKKRDSSYEISNVVVFDPQTSESSTISNTGRKDCNIERVLFSQPANVTGSALNFQLVTRKGGDMVITLNWQLGILDVPDEDLFTRDILRRVRELLTEVCH
ncbi:unnamed protein product [Penicillium olsonii]|nr:unnamed protein product [Penicillium olsonii]